MKSYKDFEFTYNENVYRVQGLLNKNLLLCVGITCEKGLIIEEYELSKYFDEDVVQHIQHVIKKKIHEKAL